MPRPPSGTKAKTRVYRIPSDLNEWLKNAVTSYKMRSGKYANSKIDVVRDALEWVREHPEKCKIPEREFAGVPMHEHVHADGGVLNTFRLPEPLIEWLEDYYRFHRMRDRKTRAADFTDLIVDALERARERNLVGTRGK